MKVQVQVTVSKYAIKYTEGLMEYTSLDVFVTANATQLYIANTYSCQAK